MGPTLQNHQPKDEDKKEIERPLTREQRRAQDRVRQEANDILDKLKKKFFDAFIDSDNPEGQEMVDLMDTLSKKWRFYCKNKNLVAFCYPLLDNYMKDTVKTFIETPKEVDGL